MVLLLVTVTESYAIIGMNNEYHLCLTNISVQEKCVSEKQEIKNSCLPKQQVVKNRTKKNEKKCKLATFKTTRLLIYALYWFFLFTAFGSTLSINRHLCGWVWTYVVHCFITIKYVRLDFGRFNYIWNHKLQLHYIWSQIQTIQYF